MFRELSIHVNEAIDLLSSPPTSTTQTKEVQRMNSRHHRHHRHPKLSPVTRTRKRELKVPREPNDACEVQEPPTKQTQICTVQKPLLKVSIADLCAFASKALLSQLISQRLLRAAWRSGLRCLKYNAIFTEEFILKSLRLLEEDVDMADAYNTILAITYDIQDIDGGDNYNRHEM
mmetsp:Transcript_4067/g.4977  ORF Transcript_4067/g.4977 Transcript_4067/m.4977 type:complete len:175 (+) Transcript_4067:135-659(+)